MPCYPHGKYYEKRGKEIICIDDDIPFYIPDSWAWTRLFQVADLYTGNSISETEKKLKFTNVIGRYYIGTKDVGFDNNVFYNNGVAIPKQYEHDFRIAPNHSILMCIEGGSAGRKIAILNQDVCFGNKLCCFSPFVEIGKYIYYYLQSTPFLDMFNEKKTGIIGGVSIARVKEILIPIPPFDEMGRITSKIDTLFHSLN
jgi:type I restriction enzyme S subunit